MPSITIPAIVPRVVQRCAGYYRNADGAFEAVRSALAAYSYVVDSEAFWRGPCRRNPRTWYDLHDPGGRHVARVEVDGRWDSPGRVEFAFRLVSDE